MSLQSELDKSVRNYNCVVVSCFEKMGGPDGIKFIQCGSIGQTSSENEPMSWDYCLHKSCSFTAEIERHEWMNKGDWK